MVNTIAGDIKCKVRRHQTSAISIQDIASDAPYKLSAKTYTNPVSEIERRGEKPGFYEDFSLFIAKTRRNPVSEMECETSNCQVFSRRNSNRCFLAATDSPLGGRRLPKLLPHKPCDPRVPQPRQLCTRCNPENPR